MEEEKTGWQYGDPCTNCGNSETFAETCNAHGRVTFNENGDPCHFDHRQFGQPMVVECTECNTILMDKLD